MPVIPDAQIAQALRNAGATDSVVPTMVAIALAESGGNTTAKGDIGLQNSTWGPSVGLWQIRSLNAQKGTGGTRDELSNADPQANANHAMQILNSQGLAAWSVYTSQAYRLFLSRGSAAANGSSANGIPVETTGLLSNPFTPLGTIFTTLNNHGIWLRIGAVAFGIGAVYLGIFMLVKNSSAGKAVASTAITAAEVAAV